MSAITTKINEELRRGASSSVSFRRKSQGSGAKSAALVAGSSNGFKQFNADDMDHQILADRCRRHDPDRFAVLCRMHLLFLLDLSYHEFDQVDLNLLESPTSGECISTVMSASSVSSSSSSRLKKNLVATIHRPRQQRTVDSGKVFLTEGYVDGLLQLMDFLDRDANLLQEGLFRKSGKKSRQHELYNSISAGESLNLGLDYRYNAHDCASVLKMFLADLSEPLLTEAHYAVHCQIACLPGRDKEKSSDDRRLQSLQLLFLLLPMANRNLLRRLLNLLHRVARECHVNRMNAVNLAIMFAPHILCPRKMAPEELRRKSGDLTNAVAFMIESAPQLFLMPAALIRDLQVFEDTEDEAVRTTITFCERRGPRNESHLSGRHCVGAVNDTTAVALAQLYAHVQSMPDSLKKRQLIKQFNKENKKGTPAIAGNASQNLKPQRQRNKSLRQSLKKKLFGRNQRRHATVHPVIDCSESDLKGVSTCQEGIKLGFAQVLQPVPVPVAGMEPIRHPAYCRNSANLVALRAAISRNTTTSREQDATLATLVDSRQHQPSSSSLVFHRKNPSLLAIGCEPHNVSTSDGSSSCLGRKNIIFRETSL